VDLNETRGCNDRQAVTVSDGQGPEDDCIYNAEDGGASITLHSHAVSANDGRIFIRYEAWQRIGHASRGKRRVSRRPIATRMPAREQQGRKRPCPVARSHQT